jgi:AGCS family alanine or glycine:cation symporter
MCAVFYGTVAQPSAAWGMGDVGVGIMAWLNIVGIIVIFFIAKPAIKALKDYEQQQKSGVKRYTFNPEKLGIKNASFWQERHNKENK